MEFGKLFIVLGIFFLVIGLFASFSQHFPLGNLPGDIVIKKDNFSFHFPIVSSIVVSILLSLVLWFLSR